MEFTAHIMDLLALKPEVEITILQCRPQSQLEMAAHVQIPVDLPEENVIFSTNFMVPEGLIPDIEYVIYVPPEKYYAMATQQARTNLCRAIGKDKYTTFERDIHLYWTRPLGNQ